MKCLLKNFAFGKIFELSPRTPLTVNFVLQTEIFCQLYFRAKISYNEFVYFFFLGVVLKSGELFTFMIVTRSQELMAILL